MLIPLNAHPMSGKGKSKAENMNETAEERDLGEERAWLDENFPKTRGDCEDGQRPCPFFRCRYNLVLRISRTGKVTMNFDPTDENGENRPTCALDVADEGGRGRKAIGRILNISKTETGQIEERALTRLAIRHPELGVIWREFKEK